MGAPRVARDAHGRAARAPAAGVAPVDRDRGRRALGRRPRPVAPLPVDGRLRVERDVRRPGGSRDRDQPRAGGARHGPRRRRPAARPYTADDPDLLAYVHATLVDSALAAADVYGPRLSPRDRDRYVEEMAKVAHRLGVTDPPRDAAAAAAVIDRHDAVLATPRRARPRVAARAAAAAVLAARRPTACCSRARSTCCRARARSTSGCSPCGARRVPRCARRPTCCSRARPSPRAGGPPRHAVRASLAATSHGLSPT